MYILNRKLCASRFVFLCAFFSLLLRQEQSVFQICLLSFLPFLKIQYLPPGWNGTALLIRDWNVCRDILWMCKKTGELWGVLLIKAYPPLPRLPRLHDTSPPPSFLFFFSFFCSFLSSSFEVWCVRRFNEHFSPLPILYLSCIAAGTLKPTLIYK